MSKEKEDPILRDQSDSPAKNRKHFRVVTVLMVVFVLILLGGVAMDIVFGLRLNDRTEEKTKTNDELTQLEAEEATLIVSRTLDLSNTNLVDFSLALNDAAGLMADSFIDNLNLTDNLLTTFQNNKIQQLKQLHLDGNKVTVFAFNQLNNLEKFSIEPLANLVDFSGNVISTLTVLDVAGLKELLTIKGNKLDNLVDLTLPPNLLQFNDNQLAKLQTLNLNGLNKLTSLDGNLLPISTLVIDNAALASFTKSSFPKLTTLKIYKNSFNDLFVQKFEELQSLEIDPAGGNVDTVSLNVRHCPKLTQLTVKLPAVKDAWIQNTSLIAFPDANSDLAGLKSLVLQDNVVLKTLLTKKMPNVENYEIINTPIENTDPDSPLKELEFSATSLTAFKGWKLRELQSLIIKNNVNMTVFKDNDLEKLTTLSIANQTFTESSNNTFPLLSEVKLENVPFKNVIITSDPNNMQHITFVNTMFSEDSTYDASNFPNLKDLIITNPAGYHLIGVILDNPKLTALSLNVANLQILTVRNTLLTDLSTVQNFTNLRKLEVTNTPLQQLKTSSLNFLTDLSLTGVAVTDLATTDIEELAILTLVDVPLIDLTIKNKKALVSLNLQLDKLTSLDISNTGLETFTDHNLPELLNLNLESDIITTLTISVFPKLSKLTTRLSKLTELQIMNCQLVNLNSNDLPLLEYLTFSEVPLEKFDYRFPALKTLAINDIYNPTLVMDLTDTPKLEYLEMSNNGIQALTVTSLDNLIDLVLSTPNLTALSLIQLPQLATITLSVPKIQTLLIDTVPYYTTFTKQTWNTVTSLTLKSLPINIFANNTLPLLNALELSDLTKLQEANVTNYPQLNSLKLNLPALLTLHLENLPLLTSLKDCTLAGINTLTAINVPLTEMPVLASLSILGLENVAFTTFDFAWVPQASIVYLTNSPIGELLFPDQSTTLTSVHVFNILGSGTLTTTNFAKLTELRIKNATGLKLISDNKFPELTDLELDSVAVPDFHQNNTVPKLARVTLTNSAAASGFQKFFNITAPLEEVRIESVKLQSFGINCTLGSLQSLYIVGDNSLNSLTLTGATKLKTLVIENSKLTNLTSQTLGSLTSLSINDTGALTTFADNNFAVLNDLTLSGIKIPEIDGANNTFTNLKQLVVRDSPGYVRFISCNISSLTSLQIINNPLFAEYTNNTLTNLTTLDLRSNAIVLFQNSAIPNLKILNLQHNQITTYKNITYAAIEHIALDFNKLNAVTDLFAAPNTFTSLRILTLESNLLTSFAGPAMPALQILNLGSNKIATFTAPVADALTNLNLENNQLLTLDSLNYPALTELSVANNKLTEWTGHTLPVLTKLKLSGNQITALPVLPASLQFLEFSGTGLTDLGTPALPELLLLNVANNQLTDAEVTDKIILANLPKLKYIDLTNNTITDTAAVKTALLTIYPSATILV